MKVKGVRDGKREGGGIRKVPWGLKGWGRGRGKRRRG